MSRQRHVFPTDQVFHLWAHQAQSDARNSHGNVFFDGAMIYSYGRHFPLAKIEINKRGTLVLINSRDYSVTTRKHKSLAARAVRHLTTAHVPHVDYYGAPDHKRNMAYLAREMAVHLEKAQRALQYSTVTWRASEAQCVHFALAAYIRHFFGKGRKIPTFPAAEFDAARERAQRIETPDPIRDAKKIKAREQRQVRERAALQDQFTAYCAAVAAYNTAYDAGMAAAPVVDRAQIWRDTGEWPPIFEPSGLPERPRAGHEYGRRPSLRRDFRNAGFEVPELRDVPGLARHSGPALLRVAGAEIVTSQGARIPLDHAPRLWTFIERVRASGTAYQRNGHTEHAGAFAVDSVAPDGTLTAGCHVIEYAELRRLAVGLGLAHD